MLRGIPFIYQGQEIGMENTVFHSAEEFDDVTTIDEYRVALSAGLDETEALKVASTFSRDNARTPMQWDNTENAGFTSGTPWLKVNPSYKRINVREQDQRADSLLNFYREMAALRKSPEYFHTFACGEFRPVFEDQNGLLAYHRTAERDLLILANLKPEKQMVPVSSPYKILLNNMACCEEGKDSILLMPWQGMVLEY